MTGYIVKPAVQKLIDEKVLELLRWRIKGLITSDQVRKQIAEYVQSFRGDAFAQDFEGRMILVECPFCATQHKMAADVTHFRCWCRPIDLPTTEHQIALA